MDEEEIKQLKSVLRSLVVSSPTEMTVLSLARDYRNMMGTPLPITKFGYRDPVLFLKERFADCFVFQGAGGNPVLTPIVPPQLKHIDAFVKKQKVSSKIKFKGKRRSVLEPHHSYPLRPNLIVDTFNPSNGGSSHGKERTEEFPMKGEVAEANHNENLQKSDVSRTDLRQVEKENMGSSGSSITSSEAYKNFLRRRLPVYNSNQRLDSEREFIDSDSGKSSSNSSTKQAKLDELKQELTQLVADSEDGVWCTELMRLYRERYGRELDFERFGFTHVGGLACALQSERVAVSSDPATGACRLRDARAPPPAPPPAPPARPARAASAHAPRADPEDALPWIDFDPDVFPEDCMSFSESIPALSVAELRAGDMLELMVGEVYSPSHFWFYRLGEQYNIAMEDMMDEMTKYYESEEGKSRPLALGAVRVGHYCSTVYERDWHRSLIVKLVDADTVKVRHVDYGTVDRVSRAALRPLLRRWAALPAQAVRARLGGARPVARGRRWPHAAAAAFLRLVQDRRLVGNVLHVDHEENIVELFLVDTSSERDVRIDRELVRAGHADPHPALLDAAGDTYLLPRFDALETGDTPNYAEIHAYLRDGITLDFVHDYRRHVPTALPPDLPLAPAGPAPSPPRTPPPPRAAPAPDGAPRPTLDNRVPLMSPLSCSSQSPGRSSPRSPTPTPPPPAPPPTAYVAPAARPCNSRDISTPKSDESYPSSMWSPPPPSRRLQPRAPLPPQPPGFPRAASRPPVPTPRLTTHQPTPLLPPPPPPPPVPFFVFQPPPMPMHSFQPVHLGFPPSHLPRPFITEQYFSSPSPHHRPRIDAPGPGAEQVTLSATECEIFSLLSSVDPHAAHWYMVDAISRARSEPRAAPPSRLNPEASEFRAVAPPNPRVGPPPGFAEK